MRNFYVISACLVFMAADGNVSARMPLDYMPGTVVVSGDSVFVTELSGDHVRVYGRQ